MSAQAGIWNFDGHPVDRQLIEKFSNSLRRYGPDGASSYVEGSLGLLYRPFHTTHESRSEKQPYVSRKGLLITWDGRLDNRDDLVAELGGDLGSQPSDVSIAAALFDRYEHDSLSRLVGDWAITVWNPNQRELVFSVDYMAVRHIFYYIKQDRIWWSTDLSPLIMFSPDVLHIDDDYIAGYFANDPEAHKTPYREISEVRPGHLVRIRRGSVLVERYWRFNPEARIRYKTDAEYEEHFRHIFRQSVRRRLRSDSPVLAELSGGLDSSSIVCIADDILANDIAAPQLDTLSYFDKTEPDGEDWLYFQKIEQKRGRVGTHIDRSNLAHSPAPLEYPEFVPLPGYFAAERKIEAERAEAMRRGHYRVVLSGIGGDEFMGGNPDPSDQLGDLLVELRLADLARALMMWSVVKRQPWVHLLWRMLVDLLPPIAGQYLAKRAKIENWITREFAKRTTLAIRQLNVTEDFDATLPTQRSYIACALLMANKMAKRISFRPECEEIRYPYLDQNLLNFVLSIPANQLLRPGDRRSLMRRSLRGCVPDEILSRRTKQFGARTPVASMATNWQELQAAFSSSIASSLGYIDERQFLKRLYAARNGRGIHIVRMARTISLEFWLRNLRARGMFDSGNIIGTCSRVTAQECNSQWPRYSNTLASGVAGTS